MVHLTHHDFKSAKASPTLDHFHRNRWTNSPEYAASVGASSLVPEVTGISFPSDRAHSEAEQAARQTHKEAPARCGHSLDQEMPVLRVQLIMATVGPH